MLNGGNSSVCLILTVKSTYKYLKESNILKNHKNEVTGEVQSLLYNLIPGSW